MSGPLAPIPWFDLVLILALIALNGVFAMSELAIVSSREARLKAMAKSGSAGAKARAGAGRRPGPLPVDGADRHHADRHPRRRLFGRQPRRAGGPAAVAYVRARARNRADRRLQHRHRHHDLLLAGHRRAGPQAVRAAQSRSRSRRSCRGRWTWLSQGHRAVRVAARPDQRADLPHARAQPREQECRHRRGTCTWSSPRRRPRACSRKASARSSRASSASPTARCARS